MIQGLAAVLTGLLLLGSLWLFFARVAGRQLPFLFGYTQLTVLSGSMEPVFSAGDILVIHREVNYEINDIVTFLDSSGILVTHRITAKDDNGFVTKGDANNTEDKQRVRPEDMIGRLVCIIPGAGKALLFLQSPVGVLFIIAGELFILFLPEWFYKRRQNRRKERIE